MNIKPQSGRRDYPKYADGGGVGPHDFSQDALAMAKSYQGGGSGVKSAFVDPQKYPGWPQMAGIDGPKE
jgi:hypothetical protein